MVSSASEGKIKKSYTAKGGNSLFLWREEGSQGPAGHAPGWGGAV